MSATPRPEVPAMVNVHSHAFQRDMRGSAERLSAAATDDFWSWRTAMFDAVAKLDPDSMYTVTLAVYTEMVNAGYGTVGEFHYVHHQPDGRPYAEPNAMAIAVAEAAQAAGIELVLLPAAYHRNGWRDGADMPPGPGQRRFCDPDVDTFLGRVEALRAWASSRDGVSVGVAAHSVRAVPAAWLSAIAAYAQMHELVRHVHAQEQPLELEQCQAEHGCSPIELLDAHGFLGPLTTVVHAIHVSDADVDRMARSGTIVAACPTTEANLGDGFLPALRYRDAGVRLTIGSDSNVRVDPFEEVRELETIARRLGVSRDGLLARSGDLWSELAANGAASIGVDGEQRLQVDMDHPAIRGVAESDLPYALATCAESGIIARN
ncbi:MAG TPA: formimidoylglutamate deiminase [Solirubrobacteraceae bacterium]|nr:formimidoylglutamate deiminase [Solirubrobacteraceae bacterium]